MSRSPMAVRAAIEHQYRSDMPLEEGHVLDRHSSACLRIRDMRKDGCVSRKPEVSGA